MGAVPWYLASILSNRRNFDLTSIGNSGGFSVLSLPPSSTVSLFFSPASVCSAPSLCALSAGVDPASNLGVPARLNPDAGVPVESSSPIENSNSFGSGPRVCGRLLLLRCRGLVRVDGRRAGRVAVLAASRWRACSSAMRASMAPRMRWRKSQMVDKRSETGWDGMEVPGTWWFDCCCSDPATGGIVMAERNELDGSVGVR